MRFFKRGTVLFLVILLTLQGTLVSNASEIDFCNRQVKLDSLR